MRLCACGHSDLHGKHADDGPCGAHRCDCDGFVPLWHAPVKGFVLPGQVVPDDRWQSAEYFKRYRRRTETHTARLAQGA